jgi:hypothetical protein
MPTTRADTGNALASRRHLAWPGRLVASTVLVVVSVVVVCFIALSDRTTLQSRHDLRDVAFGAPWPWLHQDDRWMGPPFPHEMSLDSPWENPTSVSLWAFLADVAVVLGVLLGLWLIGAALMRRANRTGRYRPAERLPAWRKI